MARRTFVVLDVVDITGSLVRGPAPRSADAEFVSGPPSMRSVTGRTGDPDRSYDQDRDQHKRNGPPDS